MYAGKVVEIGTVDEIFYNPKHPYTWGLIASMPSLDGSEERVICNPWNASRFIEAAKGRCFCTT